MTDLNKGRFKCADEAQAVWNVFCETYPQNTWGFWRDAELAVSQFNDFANRLHKARLIHGSIYDKHGRIEDNDVAHTIAKNIYKFKGIDNDDVCNILIRPVSMALLKRGEIRGTIFY